MSTITNGRTRNMEVQLKNIPDTSTEPSITDTHGSVTAPRPAWALSARNTDHAVMTYYGPDAEIATDVDDGGLLMVEVRAELVGFVGPSWIEWDLSPAMIHIDQGERKEGLTLKQARDLAAELLRLADEVEAAELSD